MKVCLLELLLIMAKPFQFLIGSMKVGIPTVVVPTSKFQFLIGSMKGALFALQKHAANVFQFLIGSMKGDWKWSMPAAKESFNSL